LYLQQQQNEVFLVVQEAGHVDTFFQQNCALPRTANVILDVPHDVLVAVFCHIDLQSALVVDGPGHHVHRT
jgi:hypothetical protein